MLTSAEIRQQFLDFFKSKGHHIVPSAPIVIKNDPSLLFTNAGMNQFKDYFLGNKKPDFPRIADTQKCLRVSGKHNDLEEVGVDTYHHTMFEMLGNWSFGDYFKKEAIAWSWELLTGVYGIDISSIYVTIFNGDEKEGLPRDDEAFQEWKKWIAEDRILPGSKKDNFWEMGDTGPCGPCTEIHIDCRDEEERKASDGKMLVNADHPQVIEIWNNVFIQFNRLKNGSLEPLPSRHVDTGMGFERLVRILQNKQSNYDSDIFSGTILATEQITRQQYNPDNSRRAVAFRVIADHIRAISFTIADGQLPSNTGAGYVIRRILRRAVRYYYTELSYREPLLYQLVPVIARQFATVFPELSGQQEFVAKVVQEEEAGFLRTLEKGLVHFEQFLQHPSAGQASKTEDGRRILPGPVAFELYDTYGFPLDLTKLIALEKDLLVDEPGFLSEMEKQKTRSRTATTLDSEDWITLKDSPFSEFVGYDSLEIRTRIIKYRRVTYKGKTAYQLVLEATPFYAESGGQAGDTGVLKIGDTTLEVYDTKKENNLTIHFAETLPLHPDEEVLASVNSAKRKQTALHHSATHLLHAALRKVLGTHVAQKGSLVNSEYLRFDFSHFAKLSSEELLKIESIVNEKIRENIPVIIREMPKKEALALGAMALFGEKYGELVRVVIMDPGYSVELCGGTHVGSTGELGFFKITHETAVAAGVRRVEAVCGLAAEDLVRDMFETMNGIRETLKNPKELSRALESMVKENADLKKHIEHLESRQLVIIRNELLHQDEIINQINFIGKMVEVPHPDALKRLCFDLKNHLRDYLIVLAANIDGKAYVAISIAESVTVSKKLDASKLIKEMVAPLIKGGGGGQKILATAGGTDASNLQQVIEKVRAVL